MSQYQHEVPSSCNTTVYLSHLIIVWITVELHMHMIFVPICQPMVTLPCWGVVLLFSRGIDFYFIYIVCSYASNLLDINRCILYTVLSFALIVDPLSIAQCSFRKLFYIIFLELLINPLYSIEYIIYLSNYPIIRYWSHKKCLWWCLEYSRWYLGDISSSVFPIQIYIALDLQLTSIFTSCHNHCLHCISSYI